MNPSLPEKKEPEKAKVPRKRKVKEDNHDDIEPKKTRSTKKQKDEVKTGTKTFARRYIPKSEPLRTVWLRARSAYDEIKGNFKGPSKFED